MNFHIRFLIENGKNGNLKKDEARDHSNFDNTFFAMIYDLSNSIVRADASPIFLIHSLQRVAQR